MKYVCLFGLYLAALPGMIPIKILMISIYYHDDVDDGDQRYYYIYNIYVLFMFHCAPSIMMMMIPKSPTRHDT